MSAADVTCPVCGEVFPVALEESDGHEQRMVYDCEICCRPLVIRASWADGEWRVDAAPEGGTG